MTYLADYWMDTIEYLWSWIIGSLLFQSIQGYLLPFLWVFGLQVLENPLQKDVLVNSFLYQKVPTNSQLSSSMEGGYHCIPCNRKREPGCPVLDSVCFFFQFLVPCSANAPKIKPGAVISAGPGCLIIGFSRFPVSGNLQIFFPKQAFPHLTFHNFSGHLKDICHKPSDPADHVHSS